MSVLPALAGSVVTVADPSSAAVPVARPAGAEVGDYVLMLVRNHVQGEPLTADGFDAIGPAWDRPMVDARRRVRIFGRRITDLDTEPASYTVTCPGGGRTNVVAVLARNVDAVAPVAGFGSPYGGTTVPGGTDPQTGIEIPAFELAGVPALGVALFSSDFPVGDDHVPTSTPAAWSPLADVVNYAGGGSDLTVVRTFLSAWTRDLTVTPTMPAAMTWGGVVADPGAEVIALLGTGGPAGEVPTLTEILAYPGVDGTADEVAPVYLAELTQQRRVLKAKYVGIDVGEWPADCKEALGNRVARRLQLRTLPLGLQPTMTDDGGTANVPVGGYDREIARLERPYKKRSVG